MAHHLHHFSDAGRAPAPPYKLVCPWENRPPISPLLVCGLESLDPSVLLGWEGHVRQGGRAAISEPLPALALGVPQPATPAGPPLSSGLRSRRKRKDRGEQDGDGRSGGAPGSRTQAGGGVGHADGVWTPSPGTSTPLLDAIAAAAAAVAADSGDEGRRNSPGAGTTHGVGPAHGASHSVRQAAPCTERLLSESPTPWLRVVGPCDVVQVFPLSLAVPDDLAAGLASPKPAAVSGAGTDGEAQRAAQQAVSRSRALPGQGPAGRTVPGRASRASSRSPATERWPTNGVEPGLGAGDGSGRKGRSQGGAASAVPGSQIGARETDAGRRGGGGTHRRGGPDAVDGARAPVDRVSPGARSFGGGSGVDGEWAPRRRAQMGRRGDVGDDVARARVWQQRRLSAASGFQAPAADEQGGGEGSAAPRGRGVRTSARRAAAAAAATAELLRAGDETSTRLGPDCQAEVPAGTLSREEACQDMQRGATRWLSQLVLAARVGADGALNVPPDGGAQGGAAPGAPFARPAAAPASREGREAWVVRARSELTRSLPSADVATGLGANAMGAALAPEFSAAEERAVLAGMARVGRDWDGLAKTCLPHRAPGDLARYYYNVLRLGATPLARQWLADRDAEKRAGEPEAGQHEEVEAGADKPGDQSTGHVSGKLVSGHVSAVIPGSTLLSPRGNEDAEAPCFKLVSPNLTPDPVNPIC